MLRKVDKTIRLPGVSRSSLNGTKISFRSLSSVISSWKNWEGQQTEQKQNPWQILQRKPPLSRVWRK